MAALILTLGLWLATGAHPGWTQTQITEMHRDEITGIEYPEHRDGFVAGLDVLGLGSSVALVLFGLAWVIGRGARHAG